MIAAWKQYEGQAVDGIPLLRLLGESDESAVYLAELAGEKCVIKLAPSEESAEQIPLARWQQASKLSHPNLTCIIQWGRAKMGGNGNGRSLVYLAMEYAEEALSNVDRPLTPKEVREMLTPAVSALAHVHSKGMAHGRLSPSNILSVNDVLKISGDSPLRIGERRASAKPSVYDAPELAASGVTPAADAWSLGVTLIEALTKKLPAFDGDSIRLPDAPLPESFREVALGCLTRDPALRWTVTDVQQWLERGVIPAPKHAKRKYVLPAAAVAAVVIAGVIVWPHLTGSSAAEPAAASVTAPVPESTVAAPPVNPPVTEPEAPVRPQRGKKTRGAAQPAAAVPAPVAPVQAAPEKDIAKNEAPKNDVAKSDVAKSNIADPDVAAKDLPPAAGDSIPSDVVQAVRPDVPSKARTTIHGKVPISIRLETDANGSVSDAKIESGGSSKYFADLALKAARSWKFAPGGAGGVWLVRFEFTRSTQVSTQATRIR